MTDDPLLMIPPQIQVGAGQHTVQVQQLDRGDFLEVKLTRGPFIHAERQFHTNGEVADELMPWIATEGHRIGEQLDRDQQQELRRKGYKV